MSRSWNSLPVEVLRIIFDNLTESPNKIEYQLVCKGWLMLAQQMSFEKIDLYKSNSKGFLNDIDGSPNCVGDYVRTLHLHNETKALQQRWDSFLLDLACLINLCPNVKVLTVAEVVDDMWETILLGLENGKWKGLRRIPQPTDIYYETGYYSVVSACTFLESVTLIIWENLSDENEQQLRKVIKNLETFIFLKHLDVRSFLVLSNLYDLELKIKLEKFSRLESLCIKPSYNMLSAHTPFIDQANVEIGQHLNIKLFEGRVQLSDDSILYILRKFPKLEKLALELVTGTFFSESSQQIRKNRNVIIRRFFDFVNQLESFDLSYIALKDPSDLVSSYFNLSEQPPKKVKMQYDFGTPAEANRRADVRIRSRFASGDLLWKDDPSMIDLLVLPIQLPTGDNLENLQRLEIVEDIGKHIEIFHLSASYLDYGLNPNARKVLTENFEDIILNCFSLKSIILTNIGIEYSQSINVSTEFLLLNQCPSEDITLQRASSCFPSLKYVTINSRLNYDVNSVHPYNSVVELRNNEIENLAWCDVSYSFNGNQTYNVIKKVFLKISSFDIGEQFFVFDHLGVSEIDKEKFIRYISFSPEKNLETTRHLHIMCKKIRSFTPISLYPSTTFFLGRESLK